MLEVGEVDFSAAENLDIKAIHAQALQQKLDLIYLRSPREIAYQAGEIDLQLVDRKVTYTTDISTLTTTSTATNIIISPKKEVPENDLIELSILAGNYSRFKMDKKIEQQKFVELYTLWMTNSINRRFADEVFVYQAAKKANGMITVKIKNDFADIGLISVHEKMQGKGVGRKLIEAVINWLKQEKEISRLNVVTQIDNINACRFYEKMGFVELKREFIYHLRT